MLWKMGLIELLLTDAINTNAKSIECCQLAVSSSGFIVGCILVPCALGALALLDSGCSSCLF